MTANGTEDSSQRRQQRCDLGGTGRIGIAGGSLNYNVRLFAGPSCPRPRRCVALILMEVVNDE